MSRVGTSNNVTQPDARCMSCKRWKSASKGFWGRAGDTVVNAKGAKLMVTDESVDMKWVETYGADKVAVVKKYEEPEDAGESEDK